ncbi:MAG: mandelate racemase [Acetobacteraceae bacterium SCN 69-10]|nr:mandelate racemase/muconate lactonizing enzyme family protein [Rhodospirillales bacterium]ODU59150.1 MAG: mandelate racemase [Acetobacteraceae bacterium SCN 69-10]OJY70484.1 MAG: mandelate racemase [Rhodospirillales bacterium 70-18]
MKITALRTQVVHLPLARPILSAIFEIRSADCVLVTLETDAGLAGEGLVFSINNRRLSVIHEMVRSLEPLVLGLDPTLAGGFYKRAWSELNFLGHAGVSMVGLAGVDNALWDLRGKAAGLNVSRLLGAVTTAVPVYASGGLWLSSSIDELQAEAAAFRAQGFRAMKTRVGNRDHAGDVARVRALREAVGPDVKLMVDANQQMTVPQAIRMGRALEEFNLTWFEEPIPYWNHEGEAAIAAALDTPIASGETEHTSRGILAMLRARSADILMPDLQRMGGATEFLKAAHLAEAHDTPISSHLFSEMSLPLLAALPNAIFLEHMPWFAPIYRERIELDADGNAIVPDRPGWGFSFDPEAVRRFAA